MNLTDSERASILATLRDEAIATARKHGCTCQPEPKLELTDRLYGPHRLPMWGSEHPETCPYTKWAISLGAKPDGTVLIYDTDHNSRR